MALSITYTFSTQSGNVPASELDSNFAQILNYFNIALPQSLNINPASGVPLTLIPAGGVAALSASGPIDLADAIFGGVSTTQGNISIATGTSVTLYSPTNPPGMYLVAAVALSVSSANYQLASIFWSAVGSVSGITSLITSTVFSLTNTSNNITLSSTSGSTTSFNYAVLRLV